jgi:hypothetical protein
METRRQGVRRLTAGDKQYRARFCGVWAAAGDLKFRIWPSVSQVYVWGLIRGPQ